MWPNQATCTMYKMPILTTGLKATPLVLGNKMGLFYFLVGQRPISRSILFKVFDFDRHLECIFLNGGGLCYLNLASTLNGYCPNQCTPDHPNIVVALQSFTPNFNIDFKLNFIQPIRCLRGIDRCQAPVIKLLEIWGQISDEGHPVQLNSKLCFDQFPASVSTCVVCQVEDTLAVFEKMPKDRNVLDFRAGTWIYPEGRIYI